MTCSDAVVLFEAASVTLAVKLNVPAAVGVPERTPPVESVSPPGNVPLDTLQLYGGVPPLACSTAEYDAPTCAATTFVVVIVSGFDCAGEPLFEQPCCHRTASTSAANNDKTFGNSDFRQGAEGLLRVLAHFPGVVIREAAKKLRNLGERYHRNARAASNSSPAHDALAGVMNVSGR